LVEASERGGVSLPADCICSSIRLFIHRFLGKMFACSKDFDEICVHIVH
jgi:hypothetical protein